MAGRKIDIEEKISQQKQVVAKEKERYDAALAELGKLMKKRDEQRNKELLEAVSKSEKSYEEIMAFLSGEE